MAASLNSPRAASARAHHLAPQTRGPESELIGIKISGT
jgi:hypothetical protein